MRTKFLYFIKKFFKHELVNGSVYIFVGTTIANVFAFFLNLFLARSLTYADYAIFATLLSVITLASIPAVSLNTIIVKFATDYHVRNQADRFKLLYIKFFKIIFAFSFSIFLLFTIFSAPISNFLHLDNVWYVILTGFSLLFFYLSVLNNAFLQSLLKFSFISFLIAMGGLARLLVGVLLVYLGFRAFGGIWSIVVMAFVSYLIGFYPLRKIISFKVQHKDISLKSEEILSYALPAFITILFLTSFTSMDVILVKHFFSPAEAGLYAGLSLVGKVIFYFTAPIATVMFPLLIKRHTAGDRFNNLFYLALFLVAIPSLSITLFYFLFPEFVINLFLGGRDYLVTAQYLGLFGVYLTIFSLANVCVNFFLSLNKTKVAPLVVGTSLLQIVLIYFFHDNFFEVIGVSLLACSILLVFLLSYYFKKFVV